MDAGRFLQLAEELLKTLRQDFPQFIFSNKINFTEDEVRLQNDGGLSYAWQDAAVQMSLLVRAQDSVNIFDTGIGSVYRTFDLEQVLKEAGEMLEAHLNPIAPARCGKTTGAGKPRYVRTGLGRRAQRAEAGQKCLPPGLAWWAKKLFADCFTLEVDRSSQNFFEPFFDPEGSCLEGDTLPLIENGVFRRGYADKKCAWEQHMEPTAAASGAYDDVPALALPSLSVRPTGKTLRNFWMAARPCTSSPAAVTLRPMAALPPRCRWPISTKTAAWWAGCRSSASGVT